QADGNQGVYKYSSTSYNTNQTERWDTYVKNIGTYSTLVAHYTSCTLGGKDGATLICTWDGAYMVYLPKGVTHRFATNVGASAPAITTQQDANGNVITYAYTTFTDGTGSYLSTVTDAVGRQTTYTWEHSYQVCVLHNPDGCQVWAWVYRVHTATDPYGRAATYAYNASQQIISAVKATNYTVSTTGNNASITRITDPIGHATQFAYDSNYNITMITDALGHITTCAYNSHNEPTQVVRASGLLNLTTNLSWDSPDATPLKENPLSVTNPRGISTSYTYDTNNNLTSVRRPVGTTDEELTQYTYASSGSVASVIDPRGNTTTYTHTARHQLQ